MGPVLAAPFLSEEGKESHLVKESRIEVLYPISGALVLASSLGFLVMAVQDSVEKSERNKEPDKYETQDREEEKGQAQRTTAKLVTFVALICIIFFLYCGAELVTGTYITTFVVKSSLHMTKAEGANVNTVFWGSFTMGRFLSIFLAIYLNPLHTMLLSFGLCIGKEKGHFLKSEIRILLVTGSGGVLCLFGEHSVLALQISVVVMGLGMAAVYATGFLWSEKYIMVTNKIGSAFAIFGMGAPNLFPFLIGSYIEDSPMFLMYAVFAVVLGCTLIFALAALVGRGLLKEKERASTELSKETGYGTRNAD